MAEDFFLDPVFDPERRYPIPRGHGRRHRFESGGTILLAPLAKIFFGPPLFGQWGQNIA